MYENPATGVLDSLLYDQLPLSKPGADPSPIILLAPKVWVGAHVNSFVAFANTTEALEVRQQGRPLTISVMTQAGHIVCSRDFHENENSVLLFDVRRAVRDHLELGPQPVFLTVLARGGASYFAIMAFVKNERTGNFALEHSLSPHYYMSGDQRRVRREALLFDAPA
jgi:hypothetical protein